ncbi:MAG: hypothetical protein DRR19_11950 [Candidatus Parabeggiatoa sp. nov. 1]|nr:MAG: hypothetical protein DRR19_11950 [Gammaproteobacteria bacterium]
MPRASVGTHLKRAGIPKSHHIPKMVGNNVAHPTNLSQSIQPAPPIHKNSPFSSTLRLFKTKTHRHSE